MADLALGARAVEQDGTAPLSSYRSIAVDIRRCLMLADIAADAGNGRRAAELLLGALRDLGPDFAALQADTYPK
jgi:hypothetical protein